MYDDGYQLDLYFNISVYATTESLHYIHKTKIMLYVN